MSSFSCWAIDILMIFMMFMILVLFLCGGRSGLCYFYSHSSVEHGRLKYVPEKETGPKYPDLLRKMAENHQAHLEVSLLEE